MVGVFTGRSGVIGQHHEGGIVPFGIECPPDVGGCFIERWNVQGPGNCALVDLVDRAGIDEGKRSVGHP